MNRTSRTILFWMFMILIAILMWQWSSKSSRVKQVPELNYSQFLESLGKDEIHSVQIATSEKGAATVEATKKDNSEFRVVIARENIPEVTKLLTQHGVAIRFRDVPGVDLPTVLLNVTPFVILVVLWLFMIRQMQKARKGTGGEGSNTP